MNAFSFWNLGDQLLVWGANVLLEVTLVTAAALAIARCLRRSPALRYGVLCSALLLVLLGPPIAHVMPWSGTSLMSVSLRQEAAASTAAGIELSAEPPRAAFLSSSPPFETQRPHAAAHFSAADFEKQVASSPGDAAPRRAEAGPAGELQRELARPQPIAAQEEGIAADLLVHSAATWSGQMLRVAMPPLLVVWLTGAVFLLARLTASWYRVTAILRAARPGTQARLLEPFQQAGRALRITSLPALVLSNRISAPAAAGLWRPRVILPEGLVERVSAAELRDILVHELAHTMRRDQLVVLLQNLAAATFWLHPLVRVLNRQLAQAREEVCDNYVLAATDAPSYGRTLLALAELVQTARPLPGVVGLFTSRWKLESRVAGLLDERRSRMVRLSRRGRAFVLATFLLLAATAGLAAVTLAVGGTAATGERNLDAGAAGSPPAAAPREADGEDQAANAVPAVGTKEDENKNLRTMTVRVRNQRGQPVADTNIHVSVWTLDGRREKDGGFPPNSDYQTGQDGVVQFKIPRELRILRLWAQKPDFVPLFVNFARGTHDNGRLIPDRFDFQLPSGSVLAGIVVDEEGQPVPGVQVEVRVEVNEPPWGANPEAIISTWLTDEDPVLTDERGRWSIGNAPAQVGADDRQFQLKITHKDYVSDPQWGQLQREQGITTAMLREATARVVLNSGLAITGTVTDPAGEPATRGLIVWHDHPYASSAVHEVALNEKGQFRTAPLPPGEHPITVIAPGFMPERRVVLLSASLPPLDFRLRPGERLTVRIVDADGQPVPDVHVGLRGWRGAESLYNNKHSTVPETGIPDRADAEGRFVWDWAPDDPVKYEFYAPGYSATTASLIATETEHVIQLARPLQISGTVTDASTKEIIEHFRVVPVIEFRRQFLVTEFDSAVPGKDGKYRIELPDDTGDNRRYLLRVEADGYASTLSGRSFGFAEGQLTVNFALTPSAARRGTVLDPAGRAAAGAAVIVATPSIVPQMRNNELDWSGRQVETDAEGEFQLAASTERSRIRIVHSTGFAEVLRQGDEPLGTIQLEAWARVTGTLIHDGQPVAGQQIYFQPFFAGQLGEARFQESYAAETDSNGRFEFTRLPPIGGSLRAHLGPWRDSPLTSSQSIPLDLQPGEHRTVALGGQGVSVKGKVIATGRDDVPLDKNWSLNYLIRRGPAVDPTDRLQLSFDPDGPVPPGWSLDPASDGWLKTRDHYFVKLTPGGDLQVSGVPAGQYDLSLRLYEQPAGCLVETVGERVVGVTIAPADLAAGARDIGRIEVACRAGPRPGENMQAYEFLDTTGRVRSVQEMSGRFVLLHVWASWCEPCLAHMPQVQAAVADLPPETITIVGLNIDEEAAAARALAKQQGWNWSQNYLGAGSDLTRQLAISSVPTYYLIGPDGRLAASTHEWSPMQEKIDSLVLQRGRD